MRINTTPARPAAIPSVRVNRQNPDHHIWNNNGTWWCHLTVHLPGSRKHRIRRSLKTRDRETARRRRDTLFRALRTGH